MDGRICRADVTHDAFALVVVAHAWREKLGCGVLPGGRDIA
jgi:hypothetical protein